MNLKDVNLEIKAEVDEMSTLWGAEGSDSSDPSAKSEEGSDSFESTDESNEDPSQKENEEDPKPVDEPPVDATPADDTPAEEVDFTPPAWMALLPQEVREQAEKDFKNSRGSVKAQSNRVSQLTKHLAETRAQLDKAKRLSQTLPTIDLASDKDLEELGKEWPDVAQSLKAVASKLGAQVAQHNASISQSLLAAQENQARALETEIAELDEVAKNEQRAIVQQQVPDVDQIVRDPKFGAWLTAQTPGVRAMINSPHAGDNITLFKLYKGATQAAPSNKDKLAEFAELPSKGGAAKAASLKDDPNADPTDFWKDFETKQKQSRK